MTSKGSDRCHCQKDEAVADHGEHAGADGAKASSVRAAAAGAALRDMIAEDKGEVTADVTSAKALTKAQADKLAKTLKATVGKT